MNYIKYFFVANWILIAACSGTQPVKEGQAEKMEPESVEAEYPIAAKSNAKLRCSMSSMLYYQKTTDAKSSGLTEQEAFDKLLQEKRSSLKREREIELFSWIISASTSYIYNTSSPNKSGFNEYCVQKFLSDKYKI
jgi:hypothetical protein